MLQVIAQSGLSAADQVPWKTAAQQWRLPYWDWAVKQDYLSPRNYGVPEVFTQQRVTILDFNGSQVQVDNPLWRFVNPRKVAMGASSMAQFGIRGQPVWHSLQKLLRIPES
jgi:Common central domain of tyrosinase